MDTLYVNDRKVAEGRIERTQPIVFSAGVSIDMTTPVGETIGSKRESHFTGRIPGVTAKVR